MNWIFLGLLLLHILCCILAYAGIKSKTFDVHKYMFFVVLFLPFWGFAILLILHYQVAMSSDGTREIQMEKLKLDSQIYKNVSIDERKNANAVVPIEEALLINSAKERRNLIMDVLNDNPKEYIEFLQKAGNNDDTEVVHYAVTAMVEISKENDYMLQKLERQYSANPDSYDVLTEYSDFLWSCLEQNLMQGQVEVMNRKFFGELLKKKLSIKESISDRYRVARNQLKLKNYTEAGETIEIIDSLRPDSEELVMLRLEYYSAIGDGKSITKLIDEIENKRIYLSAKAKEAIAFWRN